MVFAVLTVIYLLKLMKLAKGDWNVCVLLYNS